LLALWVQVADWIPWIVPKLRDWNPTATLTTANHSTLFGSMEHGDDCLGLDVKDLGQSLRSDRSATVVERVESREQLMDVG
jgi:hypothetical protein